MRKKTKFVISFVILMLIATLSLLMLSKMETCLTPTLLDKAGGSGTPVTWKPAWVDRDNNGIADSLDQEIADRVANGTAQDYMNVTVMLKSAPTTHDKTAFASCEGYLTTSPWTEALYGFGGMIPYNEIANLTKQCPNVLLIEKEAVGHSTLDYAAQQVGARTYVWSTLGLQGDPNSSVAIVDTGIDASHPDFSPGFGDQNFSKKIVGWNNQINATATPFDDNGHGSHVSGLAAGDGFFSVDASGDAAATWGANLTAISSSGMYLISGMMVNKTGTITIKVKWATTGTATLAALPLYYGDKNLSIGSWISVNSTYTPNQNTWYTLTYKVNSTPSGGYDMYHVLMALTQGTGNLYAVFTMSWPYTPPSDGFSAWTGIAPQAKLVGVKVLDHSGSGTSTELINGINWIIANRMTYHITVASMSLGFDSEVTAVDSAVVNLVNSGVTTVVAAGNSGSGSNYVYTPGSVDEVITVAAMNQFDNMTDYSSQGGASGYTGGTVKPDITAPGGSFYAVPLFSADSNNGDGEGWWSDVRANDSAPMQGTSMSAPVVAGAAEIVVQAMGGYANWNWTRSQALQPKMILLMTATETYPNLREEGSSSASPTLDRGGKDVHEGYGRMNLDAAVEAVNKTYMVGTTVTGTLGRPPTPSDISVLGQRLAWARNVQLLSDQTYNFSLSVPLGADYDLYLYNNTGTAYGEPSIVAKSINATTGGTEQFWVKAPYTGTYCIVVKRATETTQSGTFTLTSLGPVYVTFCQTDISSDFTGTVVTIDGTNYGYTSLPKSFWWYNGSSHTFAYSSQLVVTANQKQYVLTGVNETSPLTVSKNETVTGTYKTQYYFTFSQTGVSSDFAGAVVNVEGSNYSVGTLPVSFWYDSGSGHSFTFHSPLVVASSQKQYVWTSTTGPSTSQSGSITVSDYGTVTGNYKTQYYVTVTSAHDTPTASAWVDSDVSFTASVTSPTEVVSGDHQWVCTGFSVDGAESTPGMSYTLTSVGAAHTIVFSWKEQFWIVFGQSDVGTDYSGTVVTVNGTDYDRSGYLVWADSGGVYNFAYSTPLLVSASGKQYVLAGVNETSGFTVSGFETVTGTYEIQWNVTFAQSGVGTDFNGTVVGVDDVNFFDRSGASFWWDDQSTHSFSFQTPLIAATNVKRYLWDTTTGLSTNQSGGSFQVTTSGNVTGNYKTQWYITLNQTGVGADFADTVVTIDGANYSVVGLPVSFWYDSGSGHTFVYQSPLVATASQKQYVWTSTSGLSTLQSGSVTVSTYGDVTGNYKTQYYITVDSVHDTPTASQWIDQGSSLTVSVTSPADVSEEGTRYRCTGYTLDNNPPVADGSISYDFASIQSAHIIAFNWIAQCKVTFDQTGVGTNFSGTVVTIDEANYGVTGVNTLPASFWWDNGSSHNFLFSSPLIVNASMQHRWVSTTGLTLFQSGALTVTGSGTEIGNYGPEEFIEYTLNVSTVGSGHVTLNVSGTCHYDDVVQCTAVPVAGWNFAHWGGDLSGYANPATLTITGNMSVTATFTIQPALQISPTSEACRIYGENFNVTIQVSNALNVEDFKFEINYNATLLSVVGVSWNAWGGGTYNVDAANGNLSGYASGSPINGNVTLMTISFSATHYRIWKDISGWTNDVTGTIFVQWANLSSSSGPEFGYVRGEAQNQIIVGQDVTYNFSPIQGDLNNDGTVDLFDLRTMAACYDQQNPTYDLVGHGIIDIFDLVVIAANFGFTY